jgi:ubiquinone/menaquinone biosynthesis C-methylase UbiE
MAQPPHIEDPQFSNKMVDILNAGALNVAMAIGYKIGLFEVMARVDAPESAEMIAGRSRLNYRYVKEWLGVMSAGGIIELSVQDQIDHYFLPKAHRPYLVRSYGNGNLGVYTQEIPLLTSCVLDKVVDGFKSGKGIPYSHYPRFQSFMTELADAKHRKTLIQKFLPSVDNGRIVQRLNEGIRVCDMGCGEGSALILMADAFPKSSFIGIDILPEVINKARQDADEEGIKNIRFLVRDSAKLEQDPDLEGVFDYITAFDAIHDQSSPLDALRGIRHMLARAGVFSMIDIRSESDQAANLSHPMAPFLYTVSLMHCMPVGLVNNGAGLGMMWGRQKAVSMLEEAGFSEIEVIEMPDDPFNLHYQCRA